MIQNHQRAQQFLLFFMGAVIVASVAAQKSFLELNYIPVLITKMTGNIDEIIGSLMMEQLDDRYCSEWNWHDSPQVECSGHVGDTGGHICWCAYYTAQLGVCQTAEKAAKLYAPLHGRVMLAGGN